MTPKRSPLQTTILSHLVLRPERGVTGGMTVAHLASDTGSPYSSVASALRSLHRDGLAIRHQLTGLDKAMLGPGIVWFRAPGAGLPNPDEGSYPAAGLVEGWGHVE